MKYTLKIVKPTGRYDGLDGLTKENVNYSHPSVIVHLKLLFNMICEHGFVLEMGRSSPNAEVRPNHSAECSARFGSATCDYSAELRQKFGVILPRVCGVFRSPLTLT